MGSAKIDQYIKRHTRETNSVYISGAATKTGTYGKIVFLTAGNLTSVISTSITGSSNISSGTTIAAGIIISGKISSIKTKKGSFLIHNYE